MAGRRGEARMLREFRDFIARGNVLDLAVAVIIGAAFGTIASSLTDDLIMPLVGVLFGGVDFSSYVVPLGPIPDSYHSASDDDAIEAARGPPLGTGRFGREISGQTPAQMLVRFRQDVSALRPRVVHIMAGTNDIAGNLGPVSDSDLEANIESMTELAQAHGIRVILASIPPAADFPWRPGLNPGPRIVRLNAWLRDYAAKSGA